MSESDSPVTPTKVCTKCGRTLPATVDFFCLRGAGRSGFQCYCKKCSAAKQAAFRAANPEKCRAYKLAGREKAKVHRTARHAARREEDNARARAQRAAHPERARAATARWKAAHPEEERAYRVAHREEINARSAAHYAAHREQTLARGDAYRAAHPEERRAQCHNRRARLLSVPGTHTAADIAAQRTRQKGRCYWMATPACQARGGRVGRHYHVDHIFPVIRGGSNGPENLVIACADCNLSKGAKLPHEFSDRLC